MGHLGRDPELRYTQSGVPAVNFSVATTERWKDKAGEWQNQTEWHNIVAWRDLAERCAQRLVKGDLAHVSGKLQTRAWEEKDGNKRTTTEIVARSVKFFRKAEEGAGEGPAKAPGNKPDDGDDIPF